MKPTLNEIFNNHKIENYTKSWDSNNLNLQQSDEDAIIHWVARYGTVEEVRVLLELGASVNIRGDIGRTPLIEAVSQNNADIVSVLIEFGANISETDDYGDTALDMAEMNNDSHMINILKQSMKIE